MDHCWFEHPIREPSVIDVDEQADELPDVEPPSEPTVEAENVAKRPSPRLPSKAASSSKSASPVKSPPKPASPIKQQQQPPPSEPLPELAIDIKPSPARTPKITSPITPIASPRFEPNDREKTIAVAKLVRDSLPAIRPTFCDAEAQTQISLRYAAAETSASSAAAVTTSAETTTRPTTRRSKAANSPTIVAAKLPKKTSTTVATRMFAIFLLDA